MARSVRKGQGDPMQALARRIHDLESDNRKRAAEEVRIQPVDEAKPRKNTPERAKQLATDHIAAQSSNRASAVPAPTVARPEALENNRTSRDPAPTVARPTVTTKQDERRAVRKGQSDPMQAIYQRIHDTERANDRGSEYERNFTSHYQR